MAVPKRKTSKTRRDKRRSAHWKLATPALVKCAKCGEFHQPSQSMLKLRNIQRPRSCQGRGEIVLISRAGVSAPAALLPKTLERGVCMSSVICFVEPKSAAARAGIQPGETLLRLNGRTVHDVLDYKFESYDPELTMELRSSNGDVRTVRLQKEEGEDPGLTFHTYLMDKAHGCVNHCVFCFIDQLPSGMRETLYFKDDDVRLSFLTGNYVTLTNVSEREVSRIIRQHISPLNISVHTTDKSLRMKMLGSRRAGDGLTIMRRFKDAGITMNCQIVCCPGINDGEALASSMRDLAEMYPEVQSVSIVPVGLTKFREGLPELKPFDALLAAKTVEQVDAFGDACLERLGSRIFFCADELYIKADREIPGDAYYEDYPQLENGVGMLRLLISEFEEALETAAACSSCEPFSVATGIAAAKYLKNILYTAQKKYANISGIIYAIQNNFFGDTVDVAGLLTGTDILEQLQGKPIGGRLLLPQNMLRQGETVFLDDMTLETLSSKLNVPLRIVRQDGADLAEAMLGR